jgi:hypothetical protein
MALAHGGHLDANEVSMGGRAFVRQSLELDGKRGHDILSCVVLICLALRSFLAFAGLHVAQNQTPPRKTGLSPTG